MRLMNFAPNGSLDLGAVIGEPIALDTGRINAKQDALSSFHLPTRTDIEPAV